MSTKPDEYTVHSADGTPIGFVKVGSGPAVVIVHGGLDTAEEWLQAAQAMAGRCTCYVMDRRGRGRSGDGVNYSLDHEVDDIKAVLDAAGRGAHLLGHSSGAIFALETARRFPVGRLVLYEPPLGFRGPRAEGSLGRMRSKVEAGQTDQALMILLKEEVDVPDETVQMLRDSPIWAQLLELFPTFMRESEGIIRLAATPDRYRDLSVPTLLLAGTETQNHPLYVTRELQAALPDARTVMLEGQGHLGNMDAPDMVARFVSDFLAS